MLLGAHETVLRSAYAVLEGHPNDRRRPGVLYLTTERLLFEAPGSRGFVRDLVSGRVPETLVDETLASLRNVTVRRGRIGRARLVVDRANLRSEFDVLEPDAWARAIADARRAAELAREPVRSIGTGHVRSVVKVRCRYCGGLGDESSDRCSSCGAPL